jgi:anti-anti-sigma factor
VIAIAGAQPVTPAKPRPVLVTLPAEIDIANAHNVREMLADAFSAGAVVIADMTATTFCDTMGIRALVLAHKRAIATGADLRLLLPCPHVMRVMEILGLDAVLPIYQSLEQAVTGRGIRDAESWGMA